MTWVKGLCIGGPLDGKYKEMRAPYFEWTVLTDPPEDLSFDASPKDTVAVRRIGYFLAQIRTSNSFYPFWTAGYEMPVSRILDTLIERYAEGKT